jgi:outer membrane receptor for ferrienterochelin and colicins
MKKIVLTMALSLVAGLCVAQSLSGKVYGTNSSGGREPLTGATLVWMNTSTGTVTDLNGDFLIAVPQGASFLVCSYVGFQPDTIRYTGQDRIDVLLTAMALTTVVNVRGELEATHMSTRNPMNFQTLNEKELCKAACCNLSESFETNASIDASFADAVTGTRQIRMLGLDGRYTQVMFDNMPAVRGLASTYGLTYVPGPWIKNIYIAKGVGSVTAGYESITGQINVAFKNPDNAEQLYVNGYGANSGRTELNVIWRPGLQEKSPGSERVRRVHLEPVLLAHAAVSQLRTDMNGDGFLDNPLFSNVILRNEWHLDTDGGLGGQYTFSYLHMNNVSGKREYDPRDEIRSQLWGVNVNTDRYEFGGKTGYVMPGKPWKSVGSQVSVSWHDQRGNYGYRAYSGQQLSARINLLFASRIVNDSHKFTTGISYIHDDYRERIFFRTIPPVDLSSLRLNRVESVPGVFMEYTLNAGERFTAVTGLRADYHNIYGFLFTPRLHARYSFTELASVKLVAGRGFRTANVIMDNVGILAGNRDIILQGNDPQGMFGLCMEQAWNTGLIFTKKFKINHRDGTFSLDAYRTDFVDQVVLDLEQAQQARFYNLEGKSYSNSAQVELQWSPFRRVDWRIAYRWLEVRTQYTEGMLDKPLVNRHRAFTNLAYETKKKANGAQWRFDATLQWISRKRIPYAGEHAQHEVQVNNNYSQDYWQLMAQVTYVFRKNLELYVGGENLTNFMVHDAIVSAENPASENFDGSLLWGPVFGRMGYTGFRWIIP